MKTALTSSLEEGNSLMDLSDVGTNIFLFLLSLFTSLGSADHSSHRCLCSLSGIFTTFLFLEEKHNTNLLPSSHTSPSSRGASILCHVYPKHHNSPPWLCPSSPRLSGGLFAVQHSRAGRGAKRKKITCQPGAVQVELAVVKPGLGSG